MVGRQVEEVAGRRVGWRVGIQTRGRGYGTLASLLWDPRRPPT